MKGVGAWLLAVMLVGGVAASYVLASGGDAHLRQRDGPVYAGVAISLVEGNGFTVPFGQPGLTVDSESPQGPLVHFPPGTSVILALPLLAGVPWPLGVAIAQGLAVGLGLIVILVAVSQTGASRWVVASAGGVYLATGLLTAVNVASEPLFLLIAVASVWAWTRFRLEGRTVDLVAGVITVVAASMVRYAGVALLAPALWAMMQRGEHRSRPLTVAARLVIMVAPVAGWLAWTSRVSGFSRGPSWHLTRGEVFEAMVSASSWVVPAQVPYIPRVLTAIGVALIAVLTILVPARRSGRRAELPELGKALVAYAMAHGTLLLVTVAFLDAQTRPIDRQVAPAMMALMIALVLLARPAIVATISLAAVAMGILAIGQIRAEQGFREQPWTSSPVMETIAELDADRVVYSNLPDAIWVVTGRSTWALPTESDPWTLERNSDLSAEVDALRRQVARTDGLVVIFDPAERPYLVDEDGLLSRGLVVNERTSFAVILDSGGRARMAKAGG